jgi:hypothetical protein
MSFLTHWILSLLAASLLAALVLSTAGLILRALRRHKGAGAGILLPLGLIGFRYAWGSLP